MPKERRETRRKSLVKTKKKWEQYYFEGLWGRVYKRINWHRLVNMYMHTLEACLWMWALFAFQYAIKLHFEMSERGGSNLGPSHWLLTPVTDSSSDFYNKYEKMITNTCTEVGTHWLTHSEESSKLIMTRFFDAYNPKQTLTSFHSHSFMSLKHIHKYHSFSSLCAFPYLLACTVSANQTLPKVPISKRVHTTQRLFLKAQNCHLIKHLHMDTDTIYKSFCALFSFFVTQSYTYAHTPTPWAAPA